ncbi:hypothetical protein AKJ45_03765 [candidate division MSBL1 archaeon SCGC-AAA261F19]|uniref:Uncharacterized protein n=1 Tax=candidate division MSBL1 archaeon SCGC-AAA261F19 TaxID=1698275 RepID=A0A133V6G6_9EURY|nr:hypothetical protein AKJ45_03765 [candidate division MSBL1 archaeon SCGC-AAA261F19]
MKVMTLSEFIESRPKEIELTESIELKEEVVRGLFKWIGHIHKENIDNLIEAIQSVYSELELRKFQEFTGLFEQGGIWEVSGEPDETSYIHMEGTHGIGELYFFWNRPRKDVLKK